MKIKRMFAALSAAVMLTAFTAGCGSSADTAASPAAEAATEAVTEASTEAATEAVTEASTEAATEAVTEASTEAATETVTEAATEADDTLIRVGSLKGPTTMGIVNLMQACEDGTSKGSYEFKMASQPDEIVSDIAAGNLDIAMVPANLAATLYNKTKGGVQVIDINTLGVIYCVTGDDSINSVKDLAGKNVLATGQGATPEYAINYLLEQNNITDCNVTYKSEATEIAALLNDDPTQIAIIPQPFATVAQVQNDKIHTAFSLSDEWDALDCGSRMLTGATIVRTDFLKEHETAVKTFMEEHAESADKAVSDVQTTADLVVKYGIIEKAPVAVKALPFCNIVCIEGEDMKTALSGYLDVLNNANPKSIGGAVPADDFYYIAE